MPPQPPPSGAAPTPLPDRVRRILVEPKAEWPRIAAEPMTVRGIMTGWVAPLAAIRPVAELVGALVFGHGALGIVYRPTLASALTTAIVDYALSVLMIWVMGRIVNALAPSFGGARDPVAAIKVAAFSATAMWLAGVFHVIPALAFLSVVGLYSFYLLYLGLPVLMRSSPERTIGYVAATVAVAAVLVILVSAITSAITTRLSTPMVTVGAVDSGKLAAKGDVPPAVPATPAARDA